MSRRRDGAPLMRYSDSPERYILRVIAISEKSIGSVRSVLSSTIVTSARPTACLPEDPEKITSSIAWPRSIFALCSPSTHRIESDMFDLPLPFGPTTTVRPGSNTSCVLSAKDLNPLSVSDFRYTSCLAFPGRGPRLLLPCLLVAHALERVERCRGL